MTNYRGNFLYGFIACGPYEVLPEWVFDKVFCPPVETDTITGEAKVAQVGLRRVEAALHQGYKKDEVFVGRIRRDFTQKHTLNMWIVADNLRKGAATNTVQIAEYLIKNKLL